MALLYVNGLYWREQFFEWEPHEDKEYISMHMSTCNPLPSPENKLIADFTFETINFIATEIYDPNYRCVYNLDNPDIYVDLVTQELRTRKQANSDFSHLRSQEKKKRIEGPILTRWEILDL